MNDDTQMKIRLPRLLKAQIEEAASGWNRSLNAEIVLRLQQSFEGAGSLEEKVKALDDQVENLGQRVRMLEYNLNKLMTGGE
jgi:hypothetical protein